MRALREAASLIWPTSCAGCGLELASPLCQCCRLELLGPVTRRESGADRLVPADGGPVLPVWSSAWYAGQVRQAITAWKRGGRAELDSEMARAVARSAEKVARVLRPVTPQLTVVPVPSRWLRQLQRVGGGTGALAAAAAGALAGAGLKVELVEALTRVSSSGEQAGRGARQRLLGREGTTRVSRRPGWPCLLVDDVLTTGATLLDAERALARVGVATVGAVVLAVSPAQSGFVANRLERQALDGAV
ncbi:MAG: hypothetical protein LBO75_04480 [Bifidobacteriaceae bacterium]|jgi:predicted amidophosphoribosyltransferase|nr:hypothetical protein [Bifidobacteriaceae bacterium]